MPSLAGVREIFDEFCSGGEQRLEAVLNGTVSDGHGQMSLSKAGLTMQDQRTPLGDEVRPEVRTQERLPKSRLQSEVELIDGLEEREVRMARAALETRLLPAGHFFGEQQSEEVPIGPAFLLGSRRDLFIDPAHVCQVEAPEVNL